jgi:uncharacterized membrane protein
MLPFHLEHTVYPRRPNDDDDEKDDGVYVFDIFTSPSRKLVSFTTSEGPTHVYVMGNELNHITSLKSDVSTMQNNA